MAVNKLAVLCAISVCFIQSCSIGKTIHIKTGYYGRRYASITGQTIKFQDKKVDQYLGIQYAHSTYNRFNKASPQLKIEKKFKAIKLPPACLQYTKSPFPWYSNTTDKSEDCLYMNIWVPSTASKKNKKSVMVWIHGGDHRFGSARNEVYNGTVLAAAGDIIVITLNYRLGVFAYFTSNSTTARGNNALKDILEALRFVSKYIGNFGGDKTKITLAGQGSGATNVLMLSFAREAKGLFTRQIVQSPIALFKQNTSELNLAYSQQLAKFKDCANDSYTIYDNSEDVATCVKSKSSADIITSDFELRPKSYLYLYPQWGDDTFKNPRDSVKNEEFHCNDLIIGVNQDEGSYLLTAYEFQDIFGFFGDKNAHVSRSVGEDIIRGIATGQSLSDPDSVVSHYLPDDLKDDEDYKIRNQVVTALGNILYHCPAVYVAEKWENKCKNAHFYLFNYRPNGSPWADWMGVTHFDEVKFVFGKPILADTRKKKREAYLSAFMVENWAEFVKTGKPKSGWHDYDAETRFYKLLNPGDLHNEIHGKNGPFSENCNFLRPKFGF